MDTLTQVRGKALCSQGALTNNIGARPPADPTALSDETQPIQDTTELSPEAHKDLQATSAGSSDAFTASVMQIVRGMELMEINRFRKSAASIHQAGTNIQEGMKKLTPSERELVSNHLLMGMQRAPIQIDPPDESILKERLSYMRALAKELLDGTGQ